MDKIAEALAPYGLPGAIALVLAFLVWRFIDGENDFTFSFSKRRRRESGGERGR